MSKLILTTTDGKVMTMTFPDGPVQIEAGRPEIDDRIDFVKDVFKWTLLDTN